MYRHVDNVMFENAHLVEQFLNYWRSTGHQRIGFLYGRYEIHTDVPLGIRATVAAIYEPPQVSEVHWSLCIAVILDRNCIMLEMYKIVILCMVKSHFILYVL